MIYLSVGTDIGSCAALYLGVFAMVWCFRHLRNFMYAVGSGSTSSFDAQV